MDNQLDFLYILEKLEDEDKDFCPECGQELFRNGRCKTCYFCGWSSCDL